MMDIITVKFLLSYASKPLRLFGAVGVICTGFGFLSALLVLLMKFGGYPILSNPFLIISVLLVLMSIQFVTNGLIAEMLMRNYHEGGAVKHIYTVREVLE